MVDYDWEKGENIYASDEDIANSISLCLNFLSDLRPLPSEEDEQILRKVMANLIVFARRMIRLRGLDIDLPQSPRVKV